MRALFDAISDVDSNALKKTRRHKLKKDIRHIGKNLSDGAHVLEAVKKTQRGVWIAKSERACALIGAISNCTNYVGCQKIDNLQLDS